MRALGSALLLCSFGLAIQAADLPARAFFEKHCIECHNAETKKGGLDLNSLQPDLADPDTFARWVKVYDRIESGEMPPKK